MRQITCVALEMTTHCNRRCKHCCAGVGMHRTYVHHDWAYFQRAAEVLYGIERLHVTGGEPTMHPRFGTFVSRFRELFGCKTMTLQTNGYGARQHQDLLNLFDHVYASVYDDANRKAVDLIQVTVPATLWPHGEAGFTPRDRRGSGKPCERGYSETVAYCDGELHGCCVGAGVEGAVGMKPTANWRTEILNHPLPCGNCFFSP